MNREPTILDYMGNTPVVKLRRVVPEGAAAVYVKLEEFNPGGSLKARVALAMITDAERTGILTPGSGQTILEATGGNTGIGLAIAAAVRGYKVILVIPDNYSTEKMALLEALGATVQRSESTKGNDSHVKMAEEIHAKHPDFVWLNQLRNPSNPGAHFDGTGEELLEYLGRVDYFVAGVGSGGTVSGVGSRLKKADPETIVVAVQPVGCDVLHDTYVAHSIQGFAIGMCPEVLNKQIVDRVKSVSYQQAVTCMRSLARHEGLVCGISAGANVFAAIDVAKGLGPDKIVATVAPDGGMSYLGCFVDTA